jgi:uncharacterized protein YrzB (UPF0473 family)
MADINDLMENPYTLIDENGEEAPFELLDVMDFEGERYYAMTPYIDEDDDSDETDAEIIILRSEQDGDEEVLATVDDDDLYVKIGNMFLERLNADLDDEE